ncbi:MAG: UDP-N-acetylmuramate--L-alanine ligase [Actinobacteria bacterium]|nr:UDP-N-acetylmuramate--L-alanine ligase [Actinomycetota bacterium]
MSNCFKDYKSYFLVGTGGAGMSAIAIVLKGMGYKVSGSDIKESRYVNLLRNEGIKIYIGHRKENIVGFDAVVYSTAIPRDNIEILAAKEKNIPIFSRSDILASILNSRKAIAVTGTHGKTTTTSMISLIFRGLDLDPTIIIGGELNELGSNARFGEGDYVIAEACESDGSFLKYKPFVGVITNIEEDHLDYYKSFENLSRSFIKFVENTKTGGLVVINGDEVKLNDIIGRKDRKIICYGIGKKNDIYAENIKISNFTSSYSLIIKKGNKKKKIDVKLNVPGIYNIKNSLAALAVCYGMEMNMEKAVEILKFFTGIKRRFEKRGEKNGALIFDDYAHHPTEIKVTLEAAKAEKRDRIITIFQPHRYTRLQNLYNKFNDCFNYSDIVVITDVYGAGEQPLPGITGKLLLNNLIDGGFKNRIVYIPRLQDICKYLELNMRENDIVLLMGAGDITRVTEELLKN